MNKASDSHTLDESRLDQVFDVWWSKLEESLNELDIPTETSEKPNKRSRGQDQTSAILEELLEFLRQQHRLLNSPDELIPRGYLASVFERYQDMVQDNHAVFSDLERVWSEMENIVSAFDEEESIPSSLVKEQFSKLRRPIIYILDRFPSRRPRSRQFRNS